MSTPPNHQEGESRGDTLPPGVSNAFVFAGFNALSFQIVLGSPMILYAKTLGASATVLGIIAGMMPLLVIFQIPAASYIPRIGYKKFVYGGWGIRVAFIFAISLVPITGVFLNELTQLSLILLLLFCFNLSRGISSCAWLPWISSLVPSAVRGRFLVRDAAWVNLCSACTLLISSVCVWGQPSPWRFSALFLFSALMGMASLFFLKRIPDVPISSEERSNSKAPVPWLEISRYRPFRKLLIMNVAWSLASGGMMAFTISYLKTMALMPEGKILLLNSTMFLGGLCSLWLVGTRLDRMGSKPMLMFSVGVWLLLVLGWFFLAAGVLEARLGTVLLLQFFMGLGQAMVSMSNTRLAMAVVPEMGRNHFFALFSVIGSLVLGLAPIFWGLFIDAFRNLEWHWGGMEFNRYTLFFGAVWLAFVVTWYLCQRLEEKEAKSLEELLHDLLVQSPQRILLRIWPRQ